MISIALCGPRCGYVLAITPPPGEEHLPPSGRSRTGTVLVVGSVYRRSADGEAPEDWRAWRWPAASGDMDVTQHCDAVDAPTAKRLEEHLQEHADTKGAWWA
jgi:hypothetical protein